MDFYGIEKQARHCAEARARIKWWLANRTLERKKELDGQIFMFSP
jgi:hypothetical protein